MAYLTSIVVLDTGQVLVLQPISGTFSAGGGFATSLGTSTFYTTSFGASVFPTADALFDMGSALLRFRNLYTSGTVSAGNIFSASIISAGTYQNIPSSGYTTIQDEGGALPQRTTINFTGTGVTASDSGSLTTVNVPGGGVGSVTIKTTTVDVGPLPRYNGSFDVSDASISSTSNVIVQLGSSGKSPRFDEVEAYPGITFSSSAGTGGMRVYWTAPQGAIFRGNMNIRYLIG